MARPHIRRPLSSASRKVPTGVSKEEWQLLQQILELLRSGALSALLPQAPTTVAPHPVSTPIREKNQVRHEDSNWKVVKSKKPASPNQVSAKTLVSKGWSVPIRAKVTELRMGSAGVCLASAAETKQIRKEMKADMPTAVLSPVNIDGEGEEISVFTTDKNGRAQTRVRYMFQLGPAPVMFRSSVPTVPTKSDCSKMVLTLLREHMEDPKWDYALKRGRSAVRLWMQERVKVDALDIGPPTRPCGDTESMQFVVYVPKVSVNGLLMASGKDGVFTRYFFESDADRNRFKIVHLPDHPTLEVAQRQSARMAEVSAGVVSTKRGFAIRVIAAHYESSVKTLHPHDSERLLGKRWEISGLPLSMGRIALMEFLDTWRVSPEYTFRQGTRRTWIVRAATDPAFTKVQHDQGLAVVNEAQARFVPTHQQIEKFVATAEHRTASVTRKATPVKSWASIVKEGRPAAVAQNSGSAVLVPQAPQVLQPTAGLETMLASAISAAMKPLHDELQKLERAVAKLQEDTQCGYSEMDDSDMDDVEGKPHIPAAGQAASASKKPRFSKVRSKVAK